MYQEEEIIKACAEKESWAQKKIFEYFEKVMFRTAYRYTNNKEDAEDVVVDSFIKVFTKIDTFKLKNSKSFENWIKTIVINNSLMILRKKKKIVFTDINSHTEPSFQIDENLESKNIYAVIMNLPIGYKTVFNLFEIEGYSHKEIAEKLNISTQTSKSQLSRAKKLLQKRLNSLNEIKHEINRP